MSRARRRGELGVELAAHEPRVAGKLYHFAKPFAHGKPAHVQTRLAEPRQVMVVHFVAMAMALGDALAAVDPAGEGIRAQRTLLPSQAHRAAELGLDVAPLD